MQKRVLISSLLLLISIFSLLFWLQSTENSSTQFNQDNPLTETLSATDNQFKKVLEPRLFNFPRDHGAHNNYRTEWWYFTGNLSTKSGRKFGYQLTFFRYALARKKMASVSAWRSNQIYMAHFAMTDVKNQRFFADEKFSRLANGLAGSETKKLRVWLYGWSASMEHSEESPIHLAARSDQFAVKLLLEVQKPLVLQGEEGFSQKTDEPGNASYYYSYTRLKTAGTMHIGEKSFEVSGLSWMDREWSTSALSSEQMGWDWFALQFSDNSELMYYQFRRKDHQPDPNSSGALFHSDNTKTHLKPTDVNIKILDVWKSPVSGVRYPARWKISIPSQQIEIEIIPLIHDQELNLSYRYWEGAVTIHGIKNGKPVTGQGYVELTGYSK